MRRAAILVVLLLAFGYYRLTGETLLASIGILSFACVAQFGPAFVGALVWRRGTALGAIAGLITGVTIWAFMLLAPSLDAGVMQRIIAAAQFPPRPDLPSPDIFNLQMSSLVRGVFWSLLGNSLAYVAFSLVRRPTPIERLQADIFVSKNAAPMAQAFRLWRTSVTGGGSRGHRRALSRRAAHARGLRDFLHRPRPDLRPACGSRHPPAAPVGTSAGLGHRRGVVAPRAVAAAAAAQCFQRGGAAAGRRRLRRPALQPRHAATCAGFRAPGHLRVRRRSPHDLLESRIPRHVRICPGSFTRTGVALDDILRFNAERGLYGDGAIDELVAGRLERLTNTEPFRVPLATSGRVIETRSARMPDGGLVVTYTDVTEQFAAEQALEAANESLERRVRERTEQLTRLNERTGARQGARPKRPIFPRRAFSPPPATTSCSRSTPRGSTPPP